MSARSHYRKPGVTLIEVAVSTVLVGLVLVAALETLGGAMRTMRRASTELQAHTLAETLLMEVVALPYSDPDGNSTGIGLESDEGSAAGDRTAFDDLDDFQGWSESPPEQRLGSSIAGCTGWTRTVEVAYLKATPASGLLATSVNDQGLKKVTVLVIDPDGTKTSLYAIRSPYGPNEAPAPFDATRVTTVEATLAVGGGASVRKGVAIPNLAEEPSP